MLRRTFRTFKWAMSPYASTEKKRLLLIYDFASQPFSLGDILIFQEAALVLRDKHRLSAIDLALVYDPANPVVSDPAFAHIGPENFLVHLTSILPAAQINPHLGSLLLFDSHRRLEIFVSDNIDEYFVWPSLADYVSREYLFYECFNRIFAEHHAKHGSLPALRSRPAIADWAKQFLQLHCGGMTPVSVQLRRNPATPARNSDYDSWLGFFSDSARRYPAKFFVICSATEVVPALRGLPNVVVAKDHYTTLEQDLALIEACSIHMGPSSGPGTMAMFNERPYCMFGFDTSPQLIDGFIQEEHRVRYPFAKPDQYWIRENETRELIEQEFSRLWAGIARGKPV